MNEHVEPLLPYLALGLAPDEVVSMCLQSFKAVAGFRSGQWFIGVAGRSAAQAAGAAGDCSEHQPRARMSAQATLEAQESYPIEDNVVEHGDGTLADGTGEATADPLPGASQNQTTELFPPCVQK